MHIKHSKQNFSKMILAIILTISLLGLMIPYSLMAYAEQAKDASKTNTNAEDSFTTLQKKIMQVAPGGNFTLDKDYRKQGPEDKGFGDITINKNIQIDLNGKTLDATGTGCSTGSIFYIEANCTLTINDSSGTNAGTLKGGSGHYVIPNNEGGAIYNKGSVVINGGTFMNNHAKFGGAILNKGNLEINGGNFLNNNSDDDGGLIYNNEVVKIANGAFDSNSAVSGSGGVIYQNSGSNKQVNITGGTFTNNTAGNLGGCIYNHYNNVVSIGGTTVIKNNTANGKINNLENTNTDPLKACTMKLIPEAPLTGNAEIGITANLGELISSGASQDTLKYLKSDDADKYFIHENGAIKVVDEASYLPTAKAEAKAEIDAAATKAKKEINPNYEDVLTGSKEETITAIDEARDKANKNIDEQTTVAGVNAAKAAGLKAIEDAKNSYTPDSDPVDGDKTDVDDQSNSAQTNDNAVLFLFGTLAILSVGAVVLRKKLYK